MTATKHLLTTLLVATAAAGATAGPADAAARLQVQNGRLLVQCDGADDRVRLVLVDGTKVGVDLNDDGGVDMAFDKATFTSILVLGGAGDDTVRVDVSGGDPTAGDPLRVEGGDGRDVLRGGPGVDTLLGQGDRDDLAGGAGGDDVQGGDRDDTIRWAEGDGADDVHGGDGAGVDTLVVTTGAGDDGVGLNQVGARAHLVLLTEEEMELEHVEHVDVDLGAGADSFDANGALRAGAGIESLRVTDGGGADADFLGGSDSHDELVATGGDDLVEGRAGHDLLVGGEGDDRLTGGDGNDVHHGAAGADRHTGGAGADAFSCGPATDTIVDREDADVVGHDCVAQPAPAPAPASAPAPAAAAAPAVAAPPAAASLATTLVRPGVTATASGVRLLLSGGPATVRVAVTERAGGRTFRYATVTRRLAGRTTVTLRASAALRRVLRRRPARSVRAVVTDVATGRTASAALRVAAGRKRAVGRR